MEPPSSVETATGNVVHPPAAPGRTSRRLSVPLAIGALLGALAMAGLMDCGDCQHLVANELGKLVGVRQARISQPTTADLAAGKENLGQSPPEAVVEYDPGRVTSKQIEGTISGLGLWPKPLP